MNRAEQIAYHRAELERLEAEERVVRPLLAAGQVWRSPNFGLRLITTQLGCGKYSLDILNADHMPYSGTQLDDCFEFVGLARDVLRVVEPKTVAQDPPEPTGQELVGEYCEFWDDSFATSRDLGVCEAFDHGMYSRDGMQNYRFAAIHRERAITHPPPRRPGAGHNMETRA